MNHHAIRSLTLEEYANYFGIDDELATHHKRELNNKRSNVYEPYLEEIRQRIIDGDTVAQIHRGINEREGLTYTVEVLRRLVHWKLKDCMPKGRRCANQYGYKSPTS